MLELYYTILYYIGILYHIGIISSNPTTIFALAFTSDNYNIEMTATAVSVLRVIHTEAL